MSASHPLRGGIARWLAWLWLPAVACALNPSVDFVGKSCADASDCDGLACVGGVCAPGDGGELEPDAGVAPDAGDAGSTSDAGDAGDAGPAPDAGDAGPADSGVVDAGDAGQGVAPDAGDAGQGDGGCGDLQSDPHNCGSCGFSCKYQNATAACVGGVCVQAACTPGYSNCAGVADAGCLTPTVTKQQCGGCGVSCGLSEACALDVDAGGGVCVPAPLCWPEQISPSYVPRILSDYFLLGPPLVADVNGDGVPDAIVPSESLGVYIWLGLPDGGFEYDSRYDLANRYGTEYSPYIYGNAVAVADLNGDGWPDLVMAGEAFSGGDAGWQGNGVAIVFGGSPALLGDGGAYTVLQGPFQLPGQPQSPTGVAVVQPFDGGPITVAVTSAPYWGGGPFDAGNVAFFRFELDAGPSAVLTPLSTFSGTGLTQSPTTGDFNGDGLQDLAVADPFVSVNKDDAGFAAATTQAAFWFGLTDGGLAYAGELVGFQSNIWYDTEIAWYIGLGPYQPMVAGDFIGAGRDQLAYTQGDFAGVPYFAVLPDGGLEGYQTLIQWLTLPQPFSALLSGDLDADGKPDLIGFDNVAGLAHVYLNRRAVDAGFLHTGDYPAGDAPFGGAVIPPQGTSPLRVVVSDYAIGGIVEMGEVGPGLFRAPALIDPAETEELGVNGQLISGALVAADLNGDGHPDLAFSWGNDAGTQGGITWLFGLGDGGFQAPNSLAVNASPTWLTEGDLAGTGQADLIVTQGNEVSVLLGNGRTFALPETYPTSSLPTKVVVLAPDAGPSALAVLNHGDNSVWTFVPDGGGRLQPGAVLALYDAGIIDMVSADFNLDGQPDLAIAEKGLLQIYLGSGVPGELQFANTAYQRYFSEAAVLAGDVNGDGYPDLVLLLGYLGYGVLLGDGSGGFSQPSLVSFFTFFTPQTGALVDVNNDGVLDLVFSTASENGGEEIGVLLGDGLGDFGQVIDAGTLYAVPAMVSGQSLGTGWATADLAGNGQVELLTLGTPYLSGVSTSEQSLVLESYSNVCGP